MLFRSIFRAVFDSSFGPGPLNSRTNSRKNRWIALETNEPEQIERDFIMTAKSTKQDKTAADTAAKAAETMASAGQEALRNFAKAGTESYEQAFSGLRGKTDEMTKGYEDLAASGKETMEAWNAAGTAYGKGMEAIGGELMNFAKRMMESNVEATKAVLGAKSLNEAMDLQSEFAHNSFEGMMTQGTKVGELATKVAQDTAEPISAQFTASVEKWRTKAA